MATTKQLVRSALLGAFVFAGKWVLSGLPNIHPVVLLLLIYTVPGRAQLGHGGVCDAGGAVLRLWRLVAGLLLGLAAVGAGRARFAQKRFGAFMGCCGGLFRPFFEALFLPVYLVEFGLMGALARLVSRIPFSVAHCAGNFVIVLALYHPP